VWGEVLLLCLSGSLYPIALAAILAYLGGPTPLRNAVAFMAGGALVCAVTGVGIAIAVKKLGLTAVKHPTPSAVVDIVLGAGVLVFSGILYLRYRKVSAADPPHVVAEPTAAEREPVLWKALVAGLLVYAPMLSYFASIKIVASHTSGVATAAAIVVCIVVTLLVVEIPIVLILVAGDRAQPVLERLSTLLARYAKPTLLVLGAAAGGYLIGKGLFAL